DCYRENPSERKCSPGRGWTLHTWHERRQRYAHPSRPHEPQDDEDGTEQQAPFAPYQTRYPISAEAGNEAEQDLHKDHSGGERYGEQCRLSRASRFGHVSERNGDRRERDRIKAEDKARQKTCSEREQSGMFDCVAERIGIQVKLLSRAV